jgi:hypothetical protein
MVLVNGLTLEESRLKRLEKQQSRYRHRFGFVRLPIYRSLSLIFLPEHSFLLSTILFLILSLPAVLMVNLLHLKNPLRRHRAERSEVEGVH